jgi:N-methylhydantoinase A
MTGLGPGFRLAIDIGGTFTDLECVNLVSGKSHSFKVPTTPDDFSLGFMAAVTGAAEQFGFELADVRLLMHGTTIATNAVLTRNLPEGALITTSGFEDVLEIGRHARKDVYSLKPERRSILVPRRRRFGVQERIGSRGEVVRSLDQDSLDKATVALRESAVDVAAVSLLNAYINPQHEIAIRDHLHRILPNLRVSCSHEVSPEIREFERTSTTVLNALLMPVVQDYISQLKRRMADAGLQAPLYLVQSNGGATTPEAAALTPVKLLLSGPSGGVLAAERLANELAVSHVVGVDMGGTSYDIALVQKGQRAIVAQGDVDGLPLRVPMVEMRTIGAGGGSIASVDPGGRLKVGPESAGAKPGPVCYGRGGTKPTTTDANVVLGRLEAKGFMRGAFPLDAKAAHAALKGHVADPLHLDVEQAAEGILSVLTAKLASAIKLSLFERGLDPRMFALMSFGGAGGLHAVEVAEVLGMQSVIFPRNPSTFSAHGILQSDIVHDLARTRILSLNDSALPVINIMMLEMATTGRQLLAADRFAADDMSLTFSMDLRYRGQAFELMLPIAADRMDELALAALIQAFHQHHLERFSFDDRIETVEMVALRLSAVGALGGAFSQPYQHRGTLRQDNAAPATRSVYLGGCWHDVPVYQQEALVPSEKVSGPAIIEQDYTTLLLTEGWQLAVTAHGDMVAHKYESRS